MPCIWSNGRRLLRVASAGGLGDSPQGLQVSIKPLSEAESQMRAFTKEVSAWILECKAWNADCKLARAENAQAMARTGNWAQRGGQNCNNEQRQAMQHQPLKGVQVKIIRTKMVMRMQPCRISHKPNTTSSVKVAHQCVTNVGDWGKSAVTALVPRITLDRDR